MLTWLGIAHITWVYNNEKGFKSLCVLTSSQKNKNLVKW